MKVGISLALFMAICGFVAPANAGNATPQTGQHAQTFDGGGAHFDYLLYLPPDYNADSARKWPLIIFLHGSGERGTDVNLVKKHGPPKIVEEKDSPLGGRFVVVSPQCAPKEHWRPDSLNLLLDDILKTYRIDKTRVYLTGLSMGGFGSWAWVENNPHRFAAVAPMSGGGDPTQAEKLKDIPFWVFHGEKDHTVNIQRDQEMVDAVKKAGDKEVKFTKYPELSHDCWGVSYGNPELYAWFLRHQLGRPAQPPAK